MPRWVGSGWSIFNNKGKPIRAYEPFFTATQAFEFDRREGASTVTFYDPPGRKVAMLHPDATWEKVVFDEWQQTTWDVNDTVAESDPRTDPDVGAYFQQALGGGPDAFVSWRDRRIGGTFGKTAAAQAANKDAAKKAESHARTPSVVHFDALGRTCLTVGDGGRGNRVATRTALDTEGKPLARFDPLGRRAFEHCQRRPSGEPRYLAGHDLVGNEIYRTDMDGGPRRTLVDVSGKLIRSWDARGHAFRVVYDRLRRPTHRYVRTAAGEILLERTIYGESRPKQNLCGRVARHYDSAGLGRNIAYDFKGNLVATTRQLARSYRASPDWSPLAQITDDVSLDRAAISLLLPTRYSSTSRFDALNRPIQLILPHSAGMRPSVIQPRYGDGGLLDHLDAWLRPTKEPERLLDPDSADVHAIENVDYNARGQRTSVSTGNGTITEFEFDPETFRLVGLTTTRPKIFPAGRRTLQALSCTYDPVGNVTRIRDDADIQGVVVYANAIVEPTADYGYDALYRLTSASGREHLGQVGVSGPPRQVTNADGPRRSALDPNDRIVMGKYVETYDYDLVGNFLSMAHTGRSGGWRRGYAYAEASQIDLAELSNRLSATSLPGDRKRGPFRATYDYDQHGNMTSMPHLPALEWDEQDRLRSTTRQIVKSGSPETTFYSYAATGERLRKVTDRQARTGKDPTRRNERVYLGPIEVYREFEPDGETVSFERETLHVMDGANRVALVDTRTSGTDGGPPQLTRYQYTNHLGSGTLELAADAKVISYEEYFPYGSTSYQAVQSETETAKRYRYTGKERDEENDLYYHGARYYIPWLARWTAPDPAAAEVLDDRQEDQHVFRVMSPYAAMGGDPLTRIDPTGKQDTAYTMNLDRQMATPEGAEEVIRNSEATYPFMSLAGAFGPAAPVFGVIDTVRDIYKGDWKSVPLDVISIVPLGRSAKLAMGETVVQDLTKLSKAEHGLDEARRIEQSAQAMHDARGVQEAAASNRSSLEGREGRT